MLAPMLERSPTGKSDSVVGLLNNNPLAHVNLLLSADLQFDDSLENRIQLEFITDIGERLENQPFNSSYGLSYNKGHIVYDTGLDYLATLDNSVIAARQDVANGIHSEYHLRRQTAFRQQGNILHNWLIDDNSSDHLIFFSLCPESSELSNTEAQRQCFKTDRLMASIQLHSKLGGGRARTTAFSLDNLTLLRLQQLFDSLGIDSRVGSSTLDQLLQPVFVNNCSDSELVGQIIETHDQGLYQDTAQYHSQGIDTEKNIVEANTFVRSHPETYSLYRQAIEEVATSLTNNEVSSGLADIVHSLSLPYMKKFNRPNSLKIYKGNRFSDYEATAFMEYLRQQAIPEYLTNILNQPVSQSNYVSDGTSFVGGISIATAGYDAQISGRSYEGACVGSGNNFLQSNNSASEQITKMGQNNKNVKIKYTYKPGYCVIPHCPSLKKRYKVPVGPCSVCESCQKLYDQGLDAVKVREPSLLDIIIHYCQNFFGFGEPNDVNQDSKDDFTLAA